MTRNFWDEIGYRAEGGQKFRDPMSNLRGMRYNLEKKDLGGRSDRDFSGGQNDHPKTAEKIAKAKGGLKTIFGKLHFAHFMA
jgi:hypothetical protein